MKAEITKKIGSTIAITTYCESAMTRGMAIHYAPSGEYEKKEISRQLSHAYPHVWGTKATFFYAEGRVKKTYFLKGSLTLLQRQKQRIFRERGIYDGGSIIGTFYVLNPHHPVTRDNTGLVLIGDQIFDLRDDDHRPIWKALDALKTSNSSEFYKLVRGVYQ